MMTSSHIPSSSFQNVSPSMVFTSMLTMIRIFVVDFNRWFWDMSKLIVPIQVWAVLFPLPQMLVGCWSCIVISSTTSAGAYYFYARVLSFCIACQIHKYYPYNKIVGPIMHTPFYVVVPYSIYWLLLLSAEASSSSDDAITTTSTTITSTIHYRFVVYTTILTSISLVLDTMTFVKWMVGYKIGVYPLRKQFQQEMNEIKNTKTS